MLTHITHCILLTLIEVTGFWVIVVFDSTSINVLSDRYHCFLITENVMSETFELLFHDYVYLLDWQRGLNRNNLNKPRLMQKNQKEAGYKRKTHSTLYP